MNTTDTFTLAGIYRPRKHGPGFGIPVFLHDGQYWVQDISSEDHVRQFVTCDVEAQTLRLPPLPTDSTMHSIGKQALYAFEAADGTMKLGTREEVSTWLQSRVTELQTTPFVLHDVAEFLGDSGLLSEAQARCDMLLQRSRKTASVPEVPSVTSGTTRAMKSSGNTTSSRSPSVPSSRPWAGSGWRATPTCPTSLSGRASARCC